MTDHWARHFNDVELLCAATRYYMGRRTIAACSFARTLAMCWTEIPGHARVVIRRDLAEAFRRDDEARAQGGDGSYYPLGMDCDRDAWALVRTAWEREDRDGRTA